MFQHTHPYPPFIPSGSKKLIVGTLPPPRFTTGALKPGDVDFCYGSRDGQLWTILDRIFGVGFSFENTAAAINERKHFLVQHRIGICDMVAMAYREKIDASDLGIEKFQLRDMIAILRQHPSIQMVLFTGGNSTNGPEYFFRKHLRAYPDINLKRLGNQLPKVHRFLVDGRQIKTVSLTAPSGSANRAVGAMTLYKKLKKENPEFSVIDFRVKQYTPFFTANT